MNIVVVGTGYVGLVTGVALAHIGHRVTCVDVDEEKVERMRQGISPIYEPGIEPLMKENMEANRLFFTTDGARAYREADVIYIAVGTPENEDGSANLTYLKQAVRDIASAVTKDVIVVTKSTVPVGTNHEIQRMFKQLAPHVHIDVVSNPEFLREGSAIHDTFHGDRIVIGADDERAAAVVADIHRPFGIPIFHTDIRSAEMIKYASNAFLATKISFINEIANICEKVGADVEQVAVGMGMDERIGSSFLRAGIGYGGSCFPKDTKALAKIAANIDHDFELLKAVIEVNNKQQRKLIEKAKKRFGHLAGKKIALLGLSFKPNTDDMREAASLVVARELVAEQAIVVAYDPIAMNKAKSVLPKEVIYASRVEEALKDADAAMILTEWDEFRQLDLSVYVKQMKTPIIFDGRNCYALDDVKTYAIEYYSIGRKSVK
ncbi:UDP-glucose/GDP-mannose dehydrogenase family protein [Anoxybacillus kestanbolensis]|uniref:UDP-glucose dehydrogenase family protein n=1 Tax=Anoxybacillus kestanbolensis TaxID=227476 RepID=UPI00208DC249|nr:UDP-glucose/GDP-mannose dehydrogenase family protein [Anoxybacillus kestanbolensis]MCL9970429.1 UDP-glucose/GDP-mannose dehydrogenase family protein [Anoxybacillus kestanbolensis]